MTSRLADRDRGYCPSAVRAELRQALLRVARLEQQLIEVQRRAAELEGADAARQKVFDSVIQLAHMAETRQLNKAEVVRRLVRSANGAK